MSSDTVTDDLGKKIVEALADNDGHAKSTTLRDDLGGVDKDRFNYRVREHLEPTGIVETRRITEDNTNIPPNELILTEDGEEYLHQLKKNNKIERNLSERVEQLEVQVSTLQEENQELRKQNQQLQSSVNQLEINNFQQEIQEIQNEINDLQIRVATIEQRPVIENEVTPHIIDTAIIAGSTSQQFLIDEFGEEQVENTRERMIKSLSEKEYRIMD